jgi:5-methylcytosine-specific restriction endonuclease McrA
MQEIISLAEARERGLKHYFTGKPCPRGHVSRRAVASKRCMKCLAEDAAKWRKDNPEEYKRRNRENIKRWRGAYPDRNNATARRYYAKNKETYIAIRERWATKNPDTVRAIQRNARARRRSAEGRHTATDVAKKRLLQKDKCACCRTKLLGGGHVDHIVPLALGGSNWPSNLQLLCPPCNYKKGHKPPEAFYRELGMLL